MKSKNSTLNPVTHYNLQKRSTRWCLPVIMLTAFGIITFMSFSNP